MVRTDCDIKKYLVDLSDKIKSADGYEYESLAYKRSKDSDVELQLCIETGLFVTETLFDMIYGTFYSDRDTEEFYEMVRLFVMSWQTSTLENRVSPFFLIQEDDDVVWDFCRILENTLYPEMFMLQMERFLYFKPAFNGEPLTLEDGDM